MSSAIPRHTRLAQVYELAFDLTKSRRARHDYTYRAALIERFLLGTHSLRSASLAWEFRAGDRRADAVLLNGSSVAFEIKSDRDSLSRVTEQLQAFLPVFETINLVVGETHVDAALERAPRGVGVLTLTDQLRFRTIRKAVPDVERICSLAVLDSVALSEAESILARLGVKLPTVPNTERYAALRDIFAHQNSRLVHAAMVDTLKVTRSALPYAGLLKRMPPVLYALALAVRPPQRHWCRLYESMNLELHEIVT